MGKLHSSQTERLLEIQGRVLDFFTTSDWALRRGEPGANDFVAGNPQEMALPSLVEVLQAHTIPKDKDWFAY
ncbi:MAG TPA: aminotransferase, partial [Actinomycetota bacterium]|nr:aminotransferase [Actinomycetota bacterium]